MEIHDSIEVIEQEAFRIESIIWLIEHGKPESVIKGYLKDHAKVLRTVANYMKGKECFECSKIYHEHDDRRFHKEVFSVQVGEEEVYLCKKHKEIKNV